MSWQAIFSTPKSERWPKNMASFGVGENQLLNFQTDPVIRSIIDNSLEFVKQDLNEREDLTFLIDRLAGFQERMEHIFAT